MMIRKIGVVSIILCMCVLSTITVNSDSQGITTTWNIETFNTSMTPNAYNIVGYIGVNNSTAELFGIDIQNVSTLSKYDVYNDTFITHIMGMSGNNFTTVHGEGYFVFLNSSGSTVYRRYPVNVCNYNTTLGHGWNIIGWTNSTMITAENITQLVGTNCTYASRYINGTYITHTKTFISNDFNMTKGLGYYVYLISNMTWSRVT